MVEACGGVLRSEVNGLGDLMSLFCVVILVFYIYFFNYTPTGVVPPCWNACLYSSVHACTAVYTLAADGAGFDTTKKN